MELEQLRRNWDAFGRERPFWAILTDRADWNQCDFFETGRAAIAQWMQRLDAHGLAARRARALDFGCGAGRLTHALAGYYAEVVGVDIATSMIELARELHRDEPRCRFVLNEREDLRAFEDDSFDLVLTLLVLQHMRPAYALGYVREFVRVLRPGGVLLMQIPSARSPRLRGARWGLRIVRRLKQWIPESLRERRRARRRSQRATQSPEPRMEMYTIRERDVVALIEALGARLVRADREQPAGDRFTSVFYTVQK